MRDRAKRVILRKNAKEMAPRLQPNSSIIGLNATPKEYRAPEVKKRMIKEAARIYHP
jgi:hypothetical protein